jgi:hypothetical protein
MFKRIFILLLVVIAGILGYATTKPTNFRIERSVTIDASADTIYNLINDFHEWSRWSPYENIDPAMTKKLSGTAKGKGAMYEWDGNNSVGSGRMEIIRTSRPTQVVIQLDFLRPMEAQNTTTFDIEAVRGGMRVTWSMEGKNNYFSKVMCVFINMDTLIGKDFEVGLENLKRTAEQKM